MLFLSTSNRLDSIIYKEGKILVQSGNNPNMPGFYPQGQPAQVPYGGQQFPLYGGFPQPTAPQCQYLCQSYQLRAAASMCRACFRQRNHTLRTFFVSIKASLSQLTALLNITRNGMLRFSKELLKLQVGTMSFLVIHRQDKDILIPMVYVDFVTFGEPIDYEYPFGSGPLANYSPR